MYIVLAIFSGFTILLSILMLGKMNMQIGLLRTTFVNFFVGAAFSILLFFIYDPMDTALLKSVPVELYFGFVIVLGITMLNGTIINKIPATYATVLVFIGQLITGLLIDFFRSHHFSLGDLIGGGVLLLGLLYNGQIKKTAVSEHPL